MSKVKVGVNVKINAYEVINRAVDDGVSYGFMRAFKHTDKPTNEHIMEEINNAIMGSLCDVLIFGDE